MIKKSRSEPLPLDQWLEKREATSVTKPYVLFDNYGLFITFATAQEAFAWIEIYTPAATTYVKIQ